MLPTRMKNIHLRLGPLGPDPAGNLRVNVIFPVDLNSFFIDNHLTDGTPSAQNDLLNQIGNELLLTLYFEGHCDWLSKTTLHKVCTASFYPSEFYHNMDGRETHVPIAVPPTYLPLDFFLDYVDIPLDDADIPGFGHIRYICDRIFGDMIDNAKSKMRTYLEENNVSHQEEIRALYQRLLLL
jgi:hypothetical protein